MLFRFSGVSLSFLLTVASCLPIVSGNSSLSADGEKPWQTLYDVEHETE